MRFKVGDRVIVRDDLVVGYDYDGCNFVSDMRKFRGTVVTICEVRDWSRRYFITEDDENWFWSDPMFACLEADDETTFAVSDDDLSLLFDEG